MPLRRLQLKLNAVVLPLVLLSVGVHTWVVYRYEFATTMQAHAIHASDGVASGPIPAETAPSAVAAGGVRMHLLFATLLAVGLSLTLNLAIHAIVLRPIGQLRERIDHMARGLWRGPAPSPISHDEMGALVAGFDQLGVQMEAIVAHLLQSERLAATALISKHLDAALTPAVDQLRRVIAELHAAGGADAQRLAGSVARATSTVLAALHEVDAPFATLATRNPRRAAERTRRGTV